ncbi:IS200/IS605 family transposase [Neolewinella antarctica]|uniref:REP element-mobilizing transposase RayT n=1 Tax=Neolewinella antarctica TaxID=442734 RepID=A0ABX0XCS2_9BACT|nr:IS200/IS605 family transposase [Neolewinella antarctica]NJC26997.1 REP element-mobilizing transposase RayT [Neolewinella antarctica]
MPASYDRIILHSVWSTKYRDPWIDLEIEAELHAVMAAEFHKWGCKVIEIGGTDDHVHVIHTLPRTSCAADVIAAVKSVSSGWISTVSNKYLGFRWQDGYGTFSVDYRNLTGLRSYVREQRAHHTPKGNYPNFKTEYTKILKSYGHADFTPQYVFPNRT